MKPIQDVSETALMVAMWRARENDRPRPLFRDPFAARLAGERGKEIVAGLPRRRVAMGAWMMAIRTRIIDDMIRAAVANGVDTVINLGAGLDARPYRMELPRNLRWIEVDFPKMIDLKSSRLADDRPVCELERLACDLADPVARQALLSSIAARTKKALILTEGVIPYLTEEQVGALADALRAHPEFGLWIADYFSHFVHRYRERLSRRMRMENAPFRFDPEDYYGFFASHGWRSKEVRTIFKAAQELGRPVPPWIRVGAMIRGFFLGRKARERMRSAFAYVLFEPDR